MSQTRKNETTIRRILFVDDEPMVLMGLQRTLRKMRHNWDMTFVSSGREALDVLGKKPMDVIVTDLRMPEMDGGRLLSEVKKQHPHLVRIILSGQLDPEMTLKSVQLAHQSLAKPCDAKVLKHTLGKLFALRDFLSDKSIKNIISKIDSLPSLPSIYTEIVSEMQSDDPAIEKVGQIISKDLSMTAKILQMVNSAFFGLLALINNSMMAGLLHDLGKLILATNFEKSYREVLAAEQGSGKNLLDLEYEVFGTSHAEIGAYLMGLWRFEKTIIEAVAFHHLPVRSMTQNLGLLTAVHVANALDHEAQSPSGENIESYYDTEYLDKLKIRGRIPQWHQICDELTKRNA